MLSLQRKTFPLSFSWCADHIYQDISAGKNFVLFFNHVSARGDREMNDMFILFHNVKRRTEKKLLPGFLGTK